MGIEEQETRGKGSPDLECEMNPFLPYRHDIIFFSPHEDLHHASKKNLGETGGTEIYETNQILCHHTRVADDNIGYRTDGGCCTGQDKS
jgi:hypothetical protein